MAEPPREVKIQSIGPGPRITMTTTIELALQTVAEGGWEFVPGTEFSLREERYYAALTDKNQSWARSHGRPPKLEDFSSAP